MSVSDMPQVVLWFCVWGVFYLCVIFVLLDWLQSSLLDQELPQSLLELLSVPPSVGHHFVQHLALERERPRLGEEDAVHLLLVLVQVHELLRALARHVDVHAVSEKVLGLAECGTLRQRLPPVSTLRAHGNPYEAVLSEGLVLKSINKRLLKSFSEFELRIPVENITEEMLTAAIDHILGSVMNDATPDVMGIMAQHLKMDLGQKDVKARILDYFDCMEEVIEVHGLGKILKSNAKLKCKIIVENLRPGTLKDQVKRAIEYDPALKAVLHRLCDVVKQEAIKNQQAFDLYQRMDKRDSGNKDNRHKKQLGRDKKQFNYDKKQVINDKKQGHHDDRRPAQRPVHRKREGPPPNGCLHCRRGDHWLEDCPTANETQKREASRAYLEKKKGGPEKTTVKRLATSDCIGDREVIFNDLVVMPYCLDNGTTYNIIPRSIVQELQILDPTVEPLKLDTPVEGVAVGGALITCTEFVDLDIGLQTVAGRVNLRGLTCIITETSEEEFLLGKRTLKALGIDVDELLAGLVTREVADIDPFDDERDYKPIAGPDADAIKARLREMVAEAVNNGFPT
ncbi:hypothetical protein PF004_g28949, partial [Phytophthora fragariae]